MKNTMQAAMVEVFGQPLVIRDRPIPVAGPGQVLVKTEAYGVCHTDLHAAAGDGPLKPAVPFTPVHEGIGVVTALGSGVTAVKLGDRVGDRVGCRGCTPPAGIVSIACQPARPSAPRPSLAVTQKRRL